MHCNSFLMVWSRDSQKLTGFGSGCHAGRRQSSLTTLFLNIAVSAQMHFFFCCCRATPPSLPQQNRIGRGFLKSYLQLNKLQSSVQVSVKKKNQSKTITLLFIYLLILFKHFGHIFLYCLLLTFMNFLTRNPSSFFPLLFLHSKKTKKNPCWLFFT